MDKYGELDEARIFEAFEDHDVEYVLVGVKRCDSLGS